MIKRVLIVGGGIGGMSAAITFRKMGIAVDLIDLDPQWRVYGAGITITGATLRAFKALGILDAVMAQAYTGDGIQVCDVNGNPLHIVPTPSGVGGDTPGCGGVMRPILHKILSEETLRLGSNVRLGLTVDAIHSHSSGVNVIFSDGTEDCYDMLVGADGVFSRVRSILFPDAPKPQYTGQCVWRIVAPRPAAITRRHFFLGGDAKVGLTPVSKDEMYMFYLEKTAKRPAIPDAQLPGELRKLLEGYGGILQDIRKNIDHQSAIVVRPLEGFLLPSPWQQGKAILIGDAAHPTTPQLASGAGLAVEDALVLGEELQCCTSVEDTFIRFMARRYDRCRLVVENSLAIGRLEQERAPAEIQTRVVQESLRALAEPI